MFQFAGSVGFSVDVGNFFQFQCAFHGDGVVDGAAEVENVVGFDEIVRYVCHVVFFYQHFFDLGGQFFETVGNFSYQFRFQCAFQLAHVEGQEQECHQLGGVCFRGGYGDFRACQGVDDMVCFAGDGGADGVGDSQALGAQAFRFFQCCQGVDGFTGLAHHDAEGLVSGQGTAVAVFGCDFYRNRNLHEPFDVVFRYEAGVVGGAAGGDEDVVDAVEAFFRPAQVVEVDRAVFVQMNLHGIMDSLGLFVNFFQHEMREAAFFCCFSTPFHFLHFFGDRISFGIIEGNAISLHHSQLAVVDDVDAAGVIDDGRDIGGDEVFAFAKADDQRIVFLGANDGVRHVFIHDYQAVGAFDDSEHFADGGEEITVVHFFQEVRYHFGVGVGFEYMAFVHELLLQSHVVFNDAIVNDDEMIVAVAMGMGISIRRLAMGGPAGVADTDVTGERMGFQRFFQICQAAFFLFDLNISISINSDTCRVIASVFQTAQSVNEKMGRLAATHITYNTTHIGILLAILQSCCYISNEIQFSCFLIQG